VRQWYLVVGVAHHSQLRLADARAILEEGLRRFADDEHLLVAAGSVHETLASPRVGLPRLPLTSAEEPPREVAAHLRIAETYYRRALERNAEAGEARLRLGRVLLDLGALGDGLREFESGRQSGFVRYSARLLSGRAHEQAGRLDDAAAFYRAAAAVCPRCQVPAIALSAVLARAGDRDAAAAALLDASAAGTASSDPWHFYDFGQRWRLDEIRLRFREEARS
jgi:tetratricopeptide (TPR) repeat protein